MFESKTVFQVVNKYECPAGNDLDGLCIFAYKSQAQAYIKYLRSELKRDETFTIKERHLI